MDGVKILQIIIILPLIGVIFYLLRLLHTARLEKRIAPFSLVTIKQTDVSLFDRINKHIWYFIPKLNHVLIKSAFLKRYGEKYNKYIIYEERDIKNGLDYIAIKFLLAFFFLLLSIIYFIFNPLRAEIALCFLVFLIGFFLPDLFLTIEYNQKRARIKEDLLKALIIMNNAFKSHRSIMQAIEIVKNELDGPIQDEFKKIYLDITYGLNIDLVFNRFYERVKLEDARYIASSLTLLNKTGGDIVKVFNMIEKSIVAQKNLEQELKSLTASSKLVFKFLLFLPFVYAIIIFCLNPKYFLPLFTTTLGIIILTFILLLYILYILVIKKIMEVNL